MYFDEDVRTAKRQQLECEILMMIIAYGYYNIDICLFLIREDDICQKNVNGLFYLSLFDQLKMLEHLHHVVLNKFKSDLDQSLRSGGGFAASARYCAQSSMVKLNARSSQISKVWCSFDSFIDDECLNRMSTNSLVKHAVWDTTEVRGKLEHHIEAHATSVRGTKLAELKANYESTWKLVKKNSWACIRRLYRHATENAILAFSASLSEFELDQITIHKMVKELREHARSIVEEKARKEAGNVLMRMNERWNLEGKNNFPLLSRDKDSMPRTWKGNEDISAITREARLAAANRLDNKPDKIDRTLTTALLDGRPLSQKRSIEFASDPIVSSTWEEVLALRFRKLKNTLITPVQCKSIWRNAETEYAVAEAISMQLSGLLTITSGFLPTIMDIITAVINISHNQKSSINSPL
ncbi:hypothetical protein DAI22_03g318200 [Oryza sativa Japonica Group]|nr:hypothetical protein DAI22_03g318200 [Oryza sativa Japonica Group]